MIVLVGVRGFEPPAPASRKQLTGRNYSNPISDLRALALDRCQRGASRENDGSPLHAQPEGGARNAPPALHSTSRPQLSVLEDRGEARSASLPRYVAGRAG